MPATASRSAPEERLVNLVVALMATEQGLTKDTILSSVTGYREQLEAGASKDALEKMFERDKENLRGLGVPIETIGNRADPDDLREARYRVPTAEYALPEDISFSQPRRDRTAQRRRRRLGQRIALGRRPQRSAQDPGPRHPGRRADHRLRPAHPRPRRVVRRAAARDRGVPRVTFVYLRPGEAQPRERRVRPLALVEYEARWHVFGFDLNMDAERTFLLSRIVGDVTLRREKFTPALREAPATGHSRACGPSPIGNGPCSRCIPEPRRRCGSRAARSRHRRACSCRTSICTSSPTSSPPMVPRCGSSRPTTCATRSCGACGPPSPCTGVSRERRDPRHPSSTAGPERPVAALDRAALLLQLVPYLLGKGEVAVTEAAADFDVAPAEMRAMVERLTVIGLPGERGYWQLPHDLFDIDWDLLDRDDVIVITNTSDSSAPRA